MNTTVAVISPSSSTSQPAVFNRALYRFSLLLCGVVAVLLFLGANVKSHEAGLAVPDWPTSFGYNMFTFPVSFWVGGIFHEHVHRLVASLTGILTVVLTAWVWWSDNRRWMRVLSAIALVAVIVQGVLGGLTVLYRLPVWTSSLHGTLGQSFFCMLVVVAYGQSQEFFQSRVSAVSPISRASLILCGALFVQLVLGNLMRHSEASLAVPDFPTMGGTFLPSINSETVAQINVLRHQIGMPAVDALQVLLHLLHRFWAAGVIAAMVMVFLAGRAISIDTRLKRMCNGIFALAMLQAILGVLVIWSQRSPLIASVHVLAGALLIGISTLLAVRSRRLR